MVRGRFRSLAHPRQDFLSFLSDGTIFSWGFENETKHAPVPPAQYTRSSSIQPSRTTPVAVTGSCCTSPTTPKKSAVAIAMVGVTNAKLARSFDICRASSQHAIRENARDTTHLLRMASPLGASPLKAEMRRSAVYSFVPLRDTSSVAMTLRVE